MPLHLAGCFCQGWEAWTALWCLAYLIFSGLRVLLLDCWNFCIYSISGFWKLETSGGEWTKVWETCRDGWLRDFFWCQRQVNHYSDQHVTNMAWACSLCDIRRVRTWPRTILTFLAGFQAIQVSTRVRSTSPMPRCLDGNCCAIFIPFSQAQLW